MKKAYECFQTLKLARTEDKGKQVQQHILNHEGNKSQSKGMTNRMEESICQLYT